MIDSRLRSLAGSHGMGAISFGTFQLLLPGVFGRLFAFPGRYDRRVIWLIRMLGLRDILLGVGIVSSAGERYGSYAPWMLARALSDGADAVGVGLTVARGTRHPRFVFLNVLAVLSALYGALLFLGAQRSGR
ncbi:MAG: hypothetical protein ACRD1H_03815 [Vicinamibacterales bacterium]